MDNRDLALAIAWLCCGWFDSAEGALNVVAPVAAVIVADFVAACDACFPRDCRLIKFSSVMALYDLIMQAMVESMCRRNV